MCVCVCVCVCVAGRSFSAAYGLESESHHVPVIFRQTRDKLYVYNGVIQRQKLFLHLQLDSNLWVTSWNKWLFTSVPYT